MRHGRLPDGSLGFRHTTSLHADFGIQDAASDEHDRCRRKGNVVNDQLGAGLELDGGDGDTDDVHGDRSEEQDVLQVMPPDAGKHEKNENNEPDD